MKKNDGDSTSDDDKSAENDEERRQSRSKKQARLTSLITDSAAITKEITEQAIIDDAGIYKALVALVHGVLGGGHAEAAVGGVVDRVEALEKRVAV